MVVSTKVAVILVVAPCGMVEFEIFSVLHIVETEVK